MKNLLQGAAVFLLLTVLISSSTNARSQGTAFTYQGRLNVGTNAATGIYDLRFALFDTLPGGTGTQQGNLLTNSATAMTNGLFTVQLDFGNQFLGAPRWLEIGVRSNGVATFSLLAPRQPLTPAPYAIYAESANASNLVGTVQSANLSGVALLNANQTFTGNNNFGSSVGINGNNLLQFGAGLAGQEPNAGKMGYEIFTPDALDIVGAGTTTARKIMFWAAGGATFEAGATFNGNVGIGTSNPPYQVSVVGPGTTGTDGILMLQTTGGTAGPQLRLNKGGPGGDEWVFVANGIVNGPVGELQIVDSNSGSSRLAIGTNGNVGIGTTSPANKLDVQGSADFTGHVGIGILNPNDIIFGLSISNSTSSNSALLLTGNHPVATGMAIENTSSGGHRYDIFSTGNGASGGGGAFSIFDENNSATRLEIIPSGNVGIGTANPGSLLTVNGSGSSAISLIGSGTNGQVDIGIASFATAYSVSAVANDAVIRQSGKGKLFLQTGSGTAAIAITTNNNVGIGTATPNSDSLLQVNGMVRMGSETGTSDAPNRSILVRRVNSTSPPTGNVVARSTTVGDPMTLERDGTAGGLILKIGPTAFAPQIVGFGITASGVTTNIILGTLNGLGNNTSKQIFTDAQRIAYCRLSFGDASHNGDMTTVELMRNVDTSINNDGTWIGTVTSTVNQ